MIKTFVFDTNVLLHDPNAINAFEDNRIVIPITVIEEIDTFKKDLTETGRNARYISRVLDDLRKKGKLSEGVEMDNGGTLQVEVDWQQAPSMPDGFLLANNDSKILAVALKLQERKTHPVYLVTKDTNLRIRADALGVNAQNYENDKISIKDQYTGVEKVVVKREELKLFLEEGKLDWDDAALSPNCFVEFSVPDEADLGKKVFGRYLPSKKIISLRTFPNGEWGLIPRNREQIFAMELLMDESIQLVTLTGVAGTGKTLLALAVGLAKVVDEKRYKKLLVSRPIFPMGKDVGFLPGDIEEKLAPWMQPIYDNMQFLMGGDGKEEEYKELMDLNIVQVEPLTYIRGRSLPSQYFIVDEAQNLTPHEIKTIISRAGEKTKIVLTGDPQQIDNPYLDASSNGLSYVANKMKGESISGHVTLRKGERSKLAEIAARLL